MTLLKTALFVSSLALPLAAQADPAWDAAHPRRAEVNGRLENQNRRIDNGVRNGQLTPGEAHRLHREDHAIRREERAMAAQNGGHITPGEQRMINRQENHVSRQIRREKHGR